MTAAAIAGAQEIATQFWQKAEAERQKAREEEAEAALRQCQEEGGCGAEGPGEETFGDPTHCYVGGQASAETGRGGAGISGYGGCNSGLPAGTWIYVCVGTKADVGFGKTEAKCEHIEVKNHTSRHWSIGYSAAVHCEEDEIVVALVEFYVPGGKALYAGTENGGECVGKSDEADEAALDLFGTSDTLDAVSGLISFFEAEME